MKPQLLKVPTGPVKSFSVRKDKLPSINNRWHYHAEVELIHFHRGSGTQFVGDSIMRFNPGDVVLIGANLPHYWRFDNGYSESPASSAYNTTIHFTETFWGEKFLELPENSQLKAMLDKARRGILINGSTRERVKHLMEKVYNAEGTFRLLALIECLLAIAESDELSYLSSAGFQQAFSTEENDRINAIYNYSLSNYQRKISLEEISEVARLVPNSFCRYFKSRTGKTYSQFLLEIRIGYACG